MVRFTVLYPQPTDPAAFDRHYMEVHVPLAKKLPDLRSYTLSRRLSAIRGPEPYYLVAELDWDDMDSLRRNFATPLGQELARDVDQLAEICPGIHGMVYELEDQ
ncbi:MAG TPA: EthD family reductase [Solirubrobacteraceae bacterium]|nr:EthD family reductase [Solirubrobacteraceae bacterium]